MDGIKMSDCRFYVNEEKRTVVCVIPNTMAMLDDYVQANFRWKDLDVWYGLISASLTEMPDHFIGKAVCSEDDKWDEETGRLIAFSRAKSKCYRSFFKRANHLVQLIDRRLGDMVESFNALGAVITSKETATQAMIEHMVEKE